MIKRPLKLLPVWLAVSAVIILAGIILMGLLGFNTSADRYESVVFEVRYNVVIKNNEEDEKALDELCVNTFAENGLTVTDTEHTLELSDPAIVRYILSADSDADALKAAKAAIDAGVKEAYPDAEVYAYYHTLSRIGGLYSTSVWRGAVALVVGAVIALVYIGFRFGIASAVTGTVVCAHDVGFSLSLMAIARIPTYAYVPLLVAGVAAVVSVALWLLLCMKLRDNAKEPELKSAPAAEAVGAAWSATWKRTLILAGVIAAVLLVAGAVAAPALRVALLPLCIPAAVSAYSCLLLGPALHIHVKGLFDKLLSKRKPRYIGKKKSEKQSAEVPENQ